VVLREVARGAVVAGDDDGGPPHVPVRERGDHERAQRLADEGGAALVGELHRRGIVIEMVEEGPKSQNPSSL
jgi:hypothetical protein